MEAKVLSTYKASSVSSFRAKLETALKTDDANLIIAVRMALARLDIADDSSDDSSTASVLN